MRVVLMGPPGAGKGTQAQLIAERFQAPHVSTGDMLRQAVNTGTTLGRKAKKYMDQGLLVPDDVVIGIVEEWFAAGNGDGAFLLDGFPRTVCQAEALDRLLARRHEPLNHVVSLAVPAADLVTRIAGRRVCGRCQAMFHVDVDPAARVAVCDRCGGALVQRADDREDTVRARLEVYERETAPVLDYYRKAGLLRDVPGTGSRDEVFGRVAKSLQ